jgi:hypothetical protein
MRATTLLRTVLGLKQTRVTGVRFGPTGIEVGVAPTTRVPFCSGCMRRVRRLYDLRCRQWRHLDVGGMDATLVYDQRRVDCPRCGVRVELVPWAEPASRFTRDFEDQVTYSGRSGQGFRSIRAGHRGEGTGADLTRSEATRLGGVEGQVEGVVWSGRMPFLSLMEGPLRAMR